MMLQPLATIRARPVLRPPMLHRHHAEPSADIVAVVDPSNAMSVYLEICFRAEPAPITATTSHSTTSFVSTELLPSPLPPSDLESADQRKPDYKIYRSLADLKKLRANIKACVGKGDHCHMCKKIAAYMTYCWERPRMLNRAWNGVMSFQLDVLSNFLNQLLRYATQLGVDSPETSECHCKFGSIVTTFLQPSAAKDV
ncbi:hypothetical protein FI667_g3521, partial [Globisporangium splendens]